MALYIHQAYGPQTVDVTYQDLGNRGLQQHQHIYAEPVIQQHQMYRTDPTVQQQIYAEHLIPQHTQIYREEDLQQHAQIYRAEDIQQHTQVYREVPQEPQPPPQPPVSAHKSTLRTHYLVHSADREGKRRKGKGKKKNADQSTEEKIVIAIPEAEAILQDTGEPNVEQHQVEMNPTVVQVQAEPDQCDMTFADNSGSHDQALMQTEQQVYLENPQAYIEQQPLTHMVHQALNIGPQGLHPLMTVDQQGIAHLGHQTLTQIAQIGHQTFTIIGQQPYCTTVEQQPLTQIVHSTMAPIIEDQNIPPGIPQGFNCDQCSKQFKRKCDLQKHYTVHSGEKTFICAVCNKSFLTKNSLQKHGFVHTGEKPHSCTLNFKLNINIGIK
ncbi:zinc finger protein 729 [Caerostris darwini]|uniref:Zinc finger protein 729 n=1 Tax=Caerostris darwini TaxID=1538125 RepID=A0AAV4T195_9ARAC|nr:zinc finger protein 729 [Caerostris darwini]